MKGLYCGQFSDRSDVESEFNENLPEKAVILYAEYEIGDYCGDATVIWREGRTYYISEASHCSCYGLEGQLHDNVERYASRKEFVACMTRMGGKWLQILQDIGYYKPTKDK